MKNKKQKKKKVVLYLTDEEKKELLLLIHHGMTRTEEVILLTSRIIEDYEIKTVLQAMDVGCKIQEQLDPFFKTKGFKGYTKKRRLSLFKRLLKGRIDSGSKLSFTLEKEKEKKKKNNKKPGGD